MGERSFVRSSSPRIASSNATVERRRGGDGLALTCCELLAAAEAPSTGGRALPPSRAIRDLDQPRAGFPPPGVLGGFAHSSSAAPPARMPSSSPQQATRSVRSVASRISHGASATPAARLESALSPFER